MFTRQMVVRAEHQAGSYLHLVPHLVVIPGHFRLQVGTQLRVVEGQCAVTLAKVALEWAGVL